MSRAHETATTYKKSTSIPRWVKLLDTAFVAVLVPYSLHAYGPTNFLYFCDVALLMTFVAVRTEKSLFAAMPAVGIFIPQAFWCADFLGTLVGWPLTGRTAYLFNPSLSFSGLRSQAALNLFTTAR